MATIVNLPGDKRADVIGEGIGQGLSGFFEGTAKRKEEEKQRKRMAQLSQALAGAETGDELRAIIPQFSDILKTPNDLKFLLDLAQKKDAKSEERTKLPGFRITDKGTLEERPFFFNEAEFDRLAQGESLSDIRPIGGQGFSATKPTVADTEAEKTFTFGRKDETGAFVGTRVGPIGSREEGEITLTELKEERERKAAQAKLLGEDEDIRTSNKEFAVNARAEAKFRGVEATKENLEKASHINDVANELSNRLVKHYRLDTEGVLEGIDPSVDGQRFIVASSLIKDLMWQGFTSGQALSTAKRAAKTAVGVPVDPALGGQDLLPATGAQIPDSGQVIETPDNRILKPGKMVEGKRPPVSFIEEDDRGRIYRDTDGTYIIYIGNDEEGNPLFINVMQ